MPKTLENSGSTSNRFNPYITEGISKRFLTPCRRVGLPKKRKTPSSDGNNSIVRTPEVDLTETNATSLTSEVVDCKQEINIESEATNFKTSEPVCTEIDTATLIIKDIDFNLKVKSESKPIKTYERKKSSVSKCLISNDTNNTSSTSSEVSILDHINISSDASADCSSFNGESFLDFDKKIRTVEKLDKKKSKKLPSEKQDIPNDKSTFILKEINSDKNTKSSKQKLKEEKLKNKNEYTAIKEVNNESSSKKHSKSVKILHKSNEKSRDKEHSPVLKIVLDKINIKDSISSITKEPEDILLKEQNSVQQLPEDSKLCSTNLQTKDHNYIKPDQKNKMLIRSLSMKKLSDEPERKKSLSPSQEDFNNAPQIITLDEINNLEKEVQEKRKLIDNLKLAEIYKQLHNVDELKELTTAWKKGCILALNDLLPHLQGHTNIDMATLLKNLRIPEKIILLSEDGNLV